MRRILDRHYALANQVAEAGSDPPADPPASTATAEGGPVGTTLLGLHVEPIDTKTLADGATLKYSKARGTFFFG